MALTLAQFIATYKGHGIIAPCTRNQTPQCVDLAAKWAMNLGKPCRIASAGNAGQMFANADTRYWRKVANTPSGRPPAGALVIWLEHNGYGHIAIARAGATSSSIPTFDQNWSVPHRCTLEVHRYGTERIVGWLIAR